jgi:hypothetical protein
MAVFPAASGSPEIRVQIEAAEHWVDISVNTDSGAKQVLYLTLHHE